MVLLYNPLLDWEHTQHNVCRINHYCTLILHCSIMNACRIFLAVLAKVFPVAWSGAHIDPVLATMCDELEKIMQKGCHHSWVNTMKLVIMDIPGYSYHYKMCTDIPNMLPTVGLGFPWAKTSADIPSMLPMVGLGFPWAKTVLTFQTYISWWVWGFPSYKNSTMIYKGM